ncbi:keratin, type II cytoskeletal 1 isoform X2 [Drosophila subpulchrella]|uniref:keratin, type II cytoskeletal 1 isoform X2 n=1 Tax=Drosophila subpulchrella TaxID=1486046 RepID=UPI0018A1964E|nr:keratin, type II cytoskeletal 1 isoform X2 [Drosophila subpulchrella]
MLKPSRGPLATRQRTLGFRPKNRERVRSTSMGLDFELDEKSGDQPDEKSSYVSLSRQNSNVQDKMSASSLGFRDHCSPSIVKLSQNGKEGREVNLIMSDGEPEAEDYHKNGDSDRRLPNSEAIGSKLKEELCKYKQELKEYNETTKDLEEKYMKINYELSEMQQKHDHLVSSRGQTSEMDMGSEADPGSFYSSASSVASKMTIRRKSPQILRSNTSFMTVLSAQSSCDDISQKKYSSERGNHPKHRNKESLSSQVDSVFDSRIVETLANRHIKRRKKSLEQDDREREPASFKDVYNVLKDVINTSQDHKYKHERDRDRDRGSGDLSQLLTTIKSLKSEQLQFRTLIRQQQERIADYHTRCVKAQDIMSTQKHEIEKLHVNNKQLESSIYHDIDSLRSKIDNKLKSVSHLPKMMRDEHSKYEKEAMQLKVKIDELGRRKLVTINRLKAAERDLKIFKNYNSALKTEKRKLTQELSTTKDQLEQLQASSKRQLSRHREQSEKQRRDLQKKIYDLELKLSRSQNSTSSLIQERDSLIAELQTQLHTLVHNFEVSQKHIRVLRRHIYSMTNPGGAGIGCSGGGSAGITHLAGGGSHRPSLIRINQQGSSTGRLGSPRTLKAKI